MMIEFEVSGKPQGKARPRFSRDGRAAKQLTPKDVMSALRPVYQTNKVHVSCAVHSAESGLCFTPEAENMLIAKYGKVAELACIARDSLVLTDIGLVPIQYVTKNMRVWDGRKWVKHGGVVSRGVKEVITYEGLTATPDHLVWVEGRRRPIPFGAAAASGARLLRTGDGWDKVRINKNNQPMESMEAKVDMSCAGCLHMLREGDRFVAWFEDGKKADILCDSSRQEVKEQVGPIRRVPVYDITNAGLHHRYTVSNVLVHNCGYGGGVNALKAFGADNMTETQKKDYTALMQDYRIKKGGATR